jgi:hypothetical protein
MNMGINAFRFEEHVPSKSVFIESFLNSPDFTHETLNKISQELSLYSRKASVNAITVQLLRRINNEIVQRTITRWLIAQKKRWCSIKLGKLTQAPKCAPVNELLFGQGEEKWYGPVSHPNDRQDVYWYVRPHFTRDWEIPEGHRDPKEYIVRWLVFARLSDQTLTIHWNGFTHAEDVSGIGKSRNQFPYWKYIPNMIIEFSKLISRTDYKEVNLTRLALHFLWDKYRYEDGYRWTDRAFRAEAGGVYMSARSGAIIEVGRDDIRGVRRLSNSLRKSVEFELKNNYKIELPDPEKFDEVILRTLLRELGTLSYEFSLSESNAENNIFRGHFYFGLKSDSLSPDSFPHIRLYFGQGGDDLQPLEFLLDHLKDFDNDEGKPNQLHLF